MLEALFKPGCISQEYDVRGADGRADERGWPRVNFFVEQIPQRVRFQAVNQGVVPGPIGLCYFSGHLHM